MNMSQKSTIILQELDYYIQIDQGIESFYLKAIVNGLVKIDKLEKETRSLNANKEREEWDL